MGWALIPEQLPDLLTAFADAEVTLHVAFERAARRHGYDAPHPEIIQFRPDRADWRISWELHTKGDRNLKYDCVRCELDVAHPSLGSESPLEVAGWIYDDCHAGPGVSNSDEIYGTREWFASTPAEAAKAVGQLAEELSRQLEEIDRGPCLTRAAGT